MISKKRYDKVKEKPFINEGKVLLVAEEGKVMNYTAKEVMQFVAEEDVKFIRLAFCDLSGVQKNVSIMPGELERAFTDGIAFDASAIDGFGGEVHSDLFLHPDPDTLTVLPWRPEHGKVVRMFCRIAYPDGHTFENDARSLLVSAVKEAEKQGYRFNIGSEMEFYLFKTDEKGHPTDEPYDKAGYMDIAPEDKGENIRREICLTLEQMGIMPESSHHEEGPGQNEIDFCYSDPLTAADNAVTFKAVVKTVAARNGLYADFSPKPIKNAPGSGLHINFSVTSKDGDVNNATIAGVLNRIAETTIFFDPSEESYLRLGANKAPSYISWSAENRSQLIRIPAATGKYRRAELRSPDPSANPYLAFAILIYAGLEGINKGMELPQEADFNFYNADAATLKKYSRLPSSRGEAALKAKGSEFVAGILPKSIIEYYCGK